MAHITDTVGPGKDYTTLALWYAAVKDDASNVHSAECYTGGNLGPVDLRSGVSNGPAWTSTESEQSWIYAAEGHEQDGSLTATQGAYVDLVGAEIIKWIGQYGGVKGLRVNGNHNHVSVTVCINIIALADNTTKLIEASNNMVVLSGGASELGIVAVLSHSTDAELRVINNEVWAANADNARGGIGIQAGLAPPFGADCLLTVHNNSVRAEGYGGAFGAFAVVVAPLSLRHTVDFQNNISACDFRNPSVPCFAFLDIPADTTWTNDYNVSSDASATGANSLINKDEDTIWQDVDSVTTPFNPKIKGEIDNGAAYNSHGPNGTASASNVDGLGRLRQTLGGSDFRGAVIVPRHPVLLMNEMNQPLDMEK